MKPPFHLVCLLTLSLVAAGFSAGCKAKQPAVDVSGLVQTLKGTDNDARLKALTDIASAGPAAEAAVPDLISTLKDADPLIRRLSAYALGQIGPKAASALPALRETLNDADMEVVKNSIIAVRFIDPNAPKDAQIQNVTQ